MLVGVLFYPALIGLFVPPCPLTPLVYPCPLLFLLFFIGLSFFHTGTVSPLSVFPLASTCVSVSL
jgi:hypothetical protein